MIIQAVLSVLLCSVIYVVGASTGCDCNCHWILPNGDPLPAKPGPNVCDCRRPTAHNKISKRRPRHQEWTWGPVERHHNLHAPPLLSASQTNNDLFAIYYEPAETFTTATFYPSQSSAVNPSGSADIFHSQEPTFNPGGSAVIHNPLDFAAVYNPQEYHSVGTTAIFDPTGSTANFYTPGYFPNLHPYYAMRNAVPQRKYHTSMNSTPGSALDNELSENGIRESFMDLGITDANENDLARAKLPNTEDEHSNFMNCMDLHLALAKMQSTPTHPILSRPWNRENMIGLNNIKDRMEILCRNPERTIQENVKAIIDGNPFKIEINVPDNGLNAAGVDAGMSSFYGESVNNELSDDSDKDHVKHIGSVPLEKSDSEKSNAILKETPRESRGDLPATTESALSMTTVDTYQDTTTDIITSTEANTDYDVAFNPKDSEAAFRMDSNEVDLFAASDSFAESKQNTDETSNMEEHNFVNLTKELEDLSETLSRAQLKKIFTGRMEFVHNNERIPLEFAQNKDGNIDLGIDGDYLCKRLLEGPEKYIILKAICNSKPPASEKSGDYEKNL